MEPVRQFRGGTSASLPNYLSKNADVSIGVARSPLVKSANMAEVVSATPPKAPCRAPRARFGRGGIPKREGLNALTAAWTSLPSANRGRESTGTGASSTRRPGKAPRQARSRPRLTLVRAQTWFCAATARLAWSAVRFITFWTWASPRRIGPSFFRRPR